MQSGRTAPLSVVAYSSQEDFTCKEATNTGRFKMYSGITKVYYRKTVGHVFMKPVQIEGTTQNIFSQ
jgi:hypothetical protein